MKSIRHDSYKKEGYFYSKTMFDVEDEEDKKDVESSQLTTTKTKKHCNVILKNMIKEKKIRSFELVCE